MIQVYKKSVTDKRNESIFLAWHVEALARTKKLPKLKDLIITEHKKQTQNDMLNVIKLLTNMYGGEVVE